MEARGLGARRQVIYALMALQPPFEPGHGLVYKVLHEDPAPLPNGYASGLRETVQLMLQKESTQCQKPQKCLRRVPPSSLRPSPLVAFLSLPTNDSPSLLNSYPPPYCG